MSKYTTQIRYICEQLSGLGDKALPKDTIAASISQIFDFDFPIYDAQYKNVLCTKILRHFYMREICAETYATWKLFLEDTLCNIMPYFNKLYESETYKFNPLYDYDLTTTSNRGLEINGKDTLISKGTTNTDNTNLETTTDNLSITRNNTTESSETGKNITDGTDKTVSSGETTATTTNTDHSTDTRATQSMDKYADTPQGTVANLENDTYLTNARQITQSGNDTHDANSDSSTKTDQTLTTDFTTDRTTNTTNSINSTDYTTGSDKREINRNNTGTINTTTDQNDTTTRLSTTTDEYISHVAGKTGGGSYAKMIMEYRDSLINIDMMILEALEPLFMGVW